METPVDITDELERHAKHVMPDYPNDVCSRAKAEIERLQAWKNDHPYSELDMDMHVEAVTKDLRAALGSCASWIDRWTSHVGTCKGGDKCTCGRTAVLFEARAIEQKGDDT